jgi:hypothetical protein
LTGQKAPATIQDVVVHAHFLPTSPGRNLAEKSPMTTEPHKVGYAARFLARAALILLALCCLAHVGRPAPEAALPRLGLLAPGTVVGKDAPKGWSHLVLKTHPRIRPDSSRAPGPS